MVAGVMSNDAKSQTACTTAFCRLLSIEKNPPIQQLIDSGVVPRFIQFLQNEQYPSLQFEAAWALTNIGSFGAHWRCPRCRGRQHLRSIFVVLLNSGNDDVREQAVWALGNIAGDSPSPPFAGTRLSRAGRCSRCCSSCTETRSFRC